MDNVIDGKKISEEIRSELKQSIKYEMLKPSVAVIQVGENEILLSDSLRLYKAMQEQEVLVKLERFKGMWHVFQMSPVKRATEAMDKIAEFVYDICL